MVRNCLKTLDFGFRRNDGKWYFIPSLAAFLCKVDRSFSEILMLIFLFVFFCMPLKCFHILKVSHCIGNVSYYLHYLRDVPQISRMSTAYFEQRPPFPSKNTH
jgi:hypothetical protein